MGRGYASPITLVDIMSEDSDTAVAPGPSKDSGVEVNALTQDDLAAFFTGGDQEVVGGDPPEAAPAADTGEEPTEPDVLSQSDDSTEEESAPPKSVQKLLKQISRLTARAKTAEEKLEELDGQSTDKQVATAGTEQILPDIQSEAELEEYAKTVRKAKRWAFENLGKGYVEHDGEEYDDDRIRSILAEADETLTELIPKKKEFLETRSQSRGQLKGLFPWMNAGDDNKAKELYTQFRSMPEFNSVHSAAKGDLIFGLMVEGYAALHARGKAPARPSRAAKPKPPATVQGGVAVPSESTESDKSKREKILGDGNVDLKSFAQYLNA